jgi:hypothetical protein
VSIGLRNTFEIVKITQRYKGGVGDYEKKYKQILGTRKVLTRIASESLDERRLVRCSRNIRCRSVAYR